MQAPGEIGSRSPKTQEKTECSSVELDLFLDLIFDGLDTKGAQKSVYEKCSTGVEIQIPQLGTNNFNLNLLLSSLNNPKKLKLQKENEESATVIHHKIITKISPDKKGRHYITQIENSVKCIKKYVDRYISNNEVEALNLHVTIILYNQGEIISNIVSALGFDKTDEEIERELTKILDFKHIFNNFKIKCKDVVSISVIDVVASTSEVIKDAVLATGGFLLRTGVFLKDILGNFLKMISGLSNVCSNKQSDFNFPSKDKITVLDAAIMCQHTYQSEAPSNKSIFSIVGKMLGQDTKIAPQDTTSIQVDTEIEKNITDYYSRLNLDTKEKIGNTTGFIKTQHNWIPVNENDEIITQTGVSLVSNLSGLFSKIYKKVNDNGVTDYAYCTAGTEPSSTNDWIFANVLQGLTGLSLQHTQSVRNAKKLNKFCKIEREKRRLFFVGHSLGGGLASNNAIITSDKHAITFNAAGLNPLRIGATLLLNNPKAYFQHDDRVSRVHPFIIDGEAVQILRFIGQPAMNAKNGYRFYDDEKIAMSINDNKILDSDKIDVIQSAPVSKLGHLNTINKHTVENFLRLKDLEALEIIYTKHE